MQRNWFSGDMLVFWGVMVNCWFGAVGVLDIWDPRKWKGLLLWSIPCSKSQTINLPLADFWLERSGAPKITMWKFQCLLHHMWWLTITPIGTPWSIKPMILGDTTTKRSRGGENFEVKAGSVMALCNISCRRIFDFCCGQEEFWLRSAYFTLPLFTI